jgi:hypothetical protein
VKAPPPPTSLRRSQERNAGRAPPCCGPGWRSRARGKVVRRREAPPLPTRSRRSSKHNAGRAPPGHRGRARLGPPGRGLMGARRLPGRSRTPNTACRHSPLFSPLLLKVLIPLLYEFVDFTCEPFFDNYEIKNWQLGTMKLVTSSHYEHCKVCKLGVFNLVDVVVVT